MRRERVNFSRRRLLVEQIVVAVLGCGMRVDAIWHVPQLLEAILEFPWSGPSYDFWSLCAKL